MKKDYKELVYLEDYAYIGEVLKLNKIPILNIVKNKEMSKIIMGKCDEVWINKDNELYTQALTWRKVVKWLH